VAPEGFHPTVTAAARPQAAGDASPGAPGSHTSDSIDDARFTPGTMLTDRYRIVGLLGKGGMGEVYRADDLKLRQSVALKFLPRALIKDQNRLDRFHHEVRVARQVSHPNVCRVYDLGDADGQPFLSMEYVDGEDMASLLRRMGRPSPDKALEIARQLCAGLAAAHDKGVLHRDLKPHNIMIDGQGRVRVTDFGLAGFVEEFADKDVRAGTLSYMAPEQLAGRGVSVKSDVYSLGLVLSELFTGKRMFEGTTREEIMRVRSTTGPPSLAGTTQDIDPVVERVILRCLEEEPSARPSSVMAVAAALPGGDPLAAALAAGETPDPSIVAASGGVGGLSQPVALGCLAAVFVGFVVVALVTSRWALYRQVPLELSAQELTARAQTLLSDWGYEELPEHRVAGFAANYKYLRYIEEHDASPTRFDALENGRPPAVLFWYRVAPEYLSPLHVHALKVSIHDPPHNEPGSVRLVLGPGGQLAQLEVIPESRPISPPADTPFDWATLFDDAGLDIAKFRETDVVKTPSVPCETLKAWQKANTSNKKVPSAGSKETDTALIVEAGLFAGRPAYFEIIGPWNRPKEAGEEDEGIGQTIGLIFGTLIAATVVIGAALLAYRNLRQGRSDRKGAMRMALFILVAMLASWVLLDVRLQTINLAELWQSLAFGRPLGHALIHACLAWVMYIALEPYIRRIWPHVLISWSRLVAGRFRDPLIGRDILVGAVFGVVISVSMPLLQQAAGWLDAPGNMPDTAAVARNTALSATEAVGLFVYELEEATIFPMFVLVLLLVARILLRRTWAAVAAFVIIPTVVVPVMVYTSVSAEMGLTPVALIAIMVVIIASLNLLILLRFGLVTAICASLIHQSLAGQPITFDFSAWYSGTSLLILALLLGLVGFGFYTSLAGRPLFKDTLFEA
jgi:serine/threonine-protein kinase